MPGAVQIRDPSGIQVIYAMLGIAMRDRAFEVFPWPDTSEPFAIWLGPPDLGLRDVLMARRII